MKFLPLASWLSVTWIAAAQAHPHPHECEGFGPWCVHLGAPAPSIGAGVPVALVIAGVLLGMRLLQSWRRS
jgi:hypothetical protein